MNLIDYGFDDKFKNELKKINDKEIIRKKIDSTKQIIALVSEGSNKFLLEAFVLGIEIINNKKEEDLIRKRRRRGAGSHFTLSLLHFMLIFFHFN